MKVLVTGATSFLGKELCKHLVETHEVTALGSKNCDLTNPASLRCYSSDEFDRIFHLAAWTQAGDFCLHHPGEQWIINQQINTNVLAWWREFQPQAKLIAIGSSCAYDPSLPMVESNYLAGTPIPSLLTYAMTKRMLYVGLISLHQQFGLEYLCVVPSTLFGPDYHTDGRQMHFIFDLIRKILRGKHCGDPVVLWGDGYQKREVMYIRDFVKALLFLSDNVSNQLVNIGAGEEHSIREFAQAICECVGYDVSRIQYDTSRYVGARSKCLDNTLLRTLIPDIQFTPFETALKDTIRWFEENWDVISSSNGCG